MSGAEVLDVARDGIYTFFKVGMPIMLIGLAIGFVISLFQALTQIQEQTLVYVPKIVSTFMGLLFLMPFMSDAMQSYMSRIATRIITGG
ncbi:MAG: flagellar biosynthesis protein FliQ [Methylocystis sp.]|jgi:flagellar biosynthetic protein FliQ|nr:flagellar biosynthesis protein FliQ [Methylocystis sp.]MCA3583417.1 flagellar biosynthesis protein FliQ [Methylocystis sp.]MCA3589118.1 flagellar biosynthesis protein FliQ [Methylocystis sp.]MCA3591936.1 flagellar biosynthesis protein FliQ [Methylocystis sp.]